MDESWLLLLQVALISVGAWFLNKYVIQPMRGSVNDRMQPGPMKDWLNRDLF